ncbi:hypothetical protein G6L11_25420 [Agrobacterium tumefaciens]|uniref:hypothetical protein n=1 Tax=Agrobacterium tumefaciens TaxID=358 RepID=UPI001EC45040|nr:hypothetical protein [Agrobacterium tumefaciens]NTA72818.1 hypothetical protein [Agrobacterium tumefaciens]
MKEFLADIRTWDGSVRQFLVDEQCGPEQIGHMWQTSQNHERCSLFQMGTAYLALMRSMIESACSDLDVVADAFDFCIELTQS